MSEMIGVSCALAAMEEMTMSKMSMSFFIDSFGKHQLIKRKRAPFEGQYVAYWKPKDHILNTKTITLDSADAVYFMQKYVIFCF